jgi:hypothetical protein
MAAIDYDALTKDDQDDDDLVKNLRSALKASVKEKAEMKSELSTMKTTSRERAISDVLKSKGVSEKAAKLLPADIDTSEDAITAWLDDYADVFGIQQNSGAVADDAEQNAQRQISRATDAMQAGEMGIEALTARIREAKTTEERNAILKQAAGA